MNCLCAGEAVVKSYALPGADNRPFLAYMVPKDLDPEEIIDNAQDRSIDHIAWHLL